MVEGERMALVPIGEWLKFNNRNFSSDSRKEFRKRFSEIRIKEIERPKGLDFEEFGALHNGIALQNFDEFCHDCFEQDDRRFVSQAWNRSRPINYDPTPYVLNITTRASYDTRHPLSDTSIRSPIRRLAHRLLTLSVAGRHSGKEKKSPIVGAHLIGRIARYYGLMTVESLTNVTLGPETSSMGVAKLVDLGICRYNGLGIGELVAEILEVARDDDVGAGQAEIGGFGRHPNMSTANRLRAMDERVGEIVSDVDELTYVVSGMSEQYDQFYGEFGQWRTE
ncbi:hypothetical protein Tco_1157225 [Tanacetum coccineum]